MLVIGCFRGLLHLRFRPGSVATAPSRLDATKCYLAQYPTSHDPAGRLCSNRWSRQQTLRFSAIHSTVENVIRRGWRLRRHIELLAVVEAWAPRADLTASQGDEDVLRALAMLVSRCPLQRHWLGVQGQRMRKSLMLIHKWLYGA